MQGDIACTLGGVDFQNFECPEEIDYFGGSQKLVKHDFPGGRRSIQSFGPFPPDEIRWSGALMVDPELGDIQARVDALQALRVGAAPAQLTVGFFNYQVMVHQVRFRMRLGVWIPYDIVLVPFIDPAADQIANPQFAPGRLTVNQQGQVSGGLQTQGTLPPVAPTSGVLGQVPEIPPTPPALSPTGAPLASAIQGPVVPAGTTQLGALNQSSFQLGAQISATNNFPDLTAATTTNLNNFQSSLVSALQQAGVTATALQSPVLLAGLATSQADMKELANSSDSGNAAFAVQTQPILQNIRNQLDVAQNAQPRSTQAVNPNLMVLAEHFYGNAIYWTYIAKENGFQTPNQIGVFDNIIIPVLP